WAANSCAPSWPVSRTISSGVAAVSTSGRATTGGSAVEGCSDLSGRALVLKSKNSGNLLRSDQGPGTIAFGRASSAHFVCPAGSFRKLDCDLVALACDTEDRARTRGEP